METHPTLGSNTDTGTGSQARDTAGDTQHKVNGQRERPEGVRERDQRAEGVEGEEYL